MRLTRLEIFGFKSFAHKIAIPFGPGITAIVGPNGCGKSNIVEAIRWVLGEQRTSIFRTHHMEEVIFAGTRTRRPLGMAEVNLVIDNSDNSLPIEFTEVTLTRRLFRSGESDYLMNKIPCRLLDIANLLMDTGLGQGAYAVMEQGMVDEIISEKAENRRRILEEAAGITKYKARRRSTWSKLESTQADLTRIEDIIGEVKRQVEYLSRQVSRARRYQELKQELDELEISLGRARYFALIDQLQPLQEELDHLNRIAEEGYTRFAVYEAELERIRLEETEAEKALQNIGLALTHRFEEIGEQDRQFVASRERLEATERLKERTRREAEEYGRQLETARQQQQEIAAALAAAQEELVHLDQRLAAQEEQAAEAEQSYLASRARLDGQQRELLDGWRDQGEFSRSLERLTTEEQGLRERLRSLEEEIETLTAEREVIRQAGEQAEGALAQSGLLRQNLQEQHQYLSQTAAAVAAERRRQRDQSDEAKRAVEANQARLQVLEKVRSEYQGYSQGVRTLMSDSTYQKLFLGALGDLIDVDPPYRQAVEAALGESLEALVAAGDQGLFEAIQYLRERAKGRIGIYSLRWPLPPLPPRASLAAAPGLIGPLLDFVRPEAQIAPLVACLLHNTYLIEDLSVALHLRCADRHLRFVTPTGEALDLYGRLSGGRSSGEEGALVGRRQEIQMSRVALAQARAHLTRLEADLRNQEVREAVLAGRLSALERRLEAIGEREREQAHLLERCRRDEQQLRERLVQRREEKEQLAVRLQELGLALPEQRQRLQAAEQVCRTLEAAIRKSEEQVQEAERLWREKLDRLAALRVERARIAETLQSLQRDAERLQLIEQGLQQQLERLAGEQAQAERNRLQLVEQGHQIEARLKELHQGREELEAERHRRQQHWAEISVRNRELEESISRLQRELNAQSERRHQLELQIADLKNQADHIRERVQQEQDRDVAAMGPLSEELDIPSAEARLEELRQSLHRLGPVSLDILKEYDEQKERCDFLCRQRDDLVAAADDLTRTLRLIDRTARRMFLETFEQIRLKFKETFVRFFPGGEADLRLQPEVDPLEAEIEITATPRGKRLQNIALLSGGERALTAIALLFALYLVKPSPFCILDEVDAPLDDANIDRFVRVLKEFAQTTQFIIVTHNKISMAAADTLHGVTMAEEGVSQLVSVKIEEEILEEAAG